MPKRISGVEKIIIQRDEPNMDRAFDSAVRQAIMRWGIDEDGHSDRVKGWERSCCSVRVVFLKAEAFGFSWCYTFETWAEKNDD